MQKSFNMPLPSICVRLMQHKQQRERDDLKATQGLKLCYLSNQNTFGAPPRSESEATNVLDNQICEA